jgi:ABC-type glycerol-3-phosphate transport system permease component
MAIAEDITILRQPQPESLPYRLPLHYAILSYGLMLLALLAMGLPLYWMLTAAFKENSEIYQLPVTWVPHAPTLENFSRAWNAAPFGRYYLNTIITTALGSGAEIVLATTSAYAFAFLRFPKKEWVFLLLLAALMVPDQVTILTNYLTIARLGWVDTYQGIVVPGAAVAYGTFLLSKPAPRSAGRRQSRWRGASSHPVERGDPAGAAGAGNVRADLDRRQVE